MKLPFGFPNRRSPDPDDAEDARPLPTDAEVQAYLDRGMKPEGIKQATPAELANPTQVTGTEAQGQPLAPEAPQTPIPGPASGGGEAKG